MTNLALFTVPYRVVNTLAKELLRCSRNTACVTDQLGLTQHSKTKKVAV